MLDGGAVVSVERPGWISPRAKIVIEEHRERSMRGTARVGRRPVAQLMWTRDGQLLYEKGLAIGWVAVSPRTDVIRFEKAKASALEPGEKASKHYAITCFYVRPGHRKRGLMTDLAKAAIDYAKKKKAAALDVCPIDTDKPLMWGEGFVGIVSVFRELGFKEVARRSPRRPLMRLSCKNK